MLILRIKIIIIKPTNLVFLYILGKTEFYKILSNSEISSNKLIVDKI